MCYYNLFGDVRRQPIAPLRDCGLQTLQSQARTCMLHRRVARARVAHALCSTCVNLLVAHARTPQTRARASTRARSWRHEEQACTAAELCSVSVPGSHFGYSWADSGNATCKACSAFVSIAFERLSSYMAY